jgi:hypothetical protein
MSYWGMFIVSALIVALSNLVNLFLTICDLVIFHTLTKRDHDFSALHMLKFASTIDNMNELISLARQETRFAQVFVIGFFRQFSGQERS